MRLPHDDTGAADGPTVVLLHARPTDRRMWAHHLPVLAAAGYRGLALDLPGYGEAAITDGRVVKPWADVIDTLDALSVERAVLVGNSLGALVSLQVAATRPERVCGLVAVGFRAHDQPSSERLDHAWARERAALEHDDVDEAVRAGVDAWTAPSTDPGVKAEVAAMLRSNLTLRGIYGEVVTAPDPLDQPDALNSISVPTLVAVGALDMPDFLTGADTLARDLHNRGPVVIPGAAHLAPLDQPAAFTTLLLSFLQKVEHRPRRRCS